MLTDAEIIDALGGTAAVATLFEIKSPSVSDWKKFGIPKARRQLLQHLRPDLFDPNAQPAQHDPDRKAAA